MENATETAGRVVPVLRQPCEDPSECGGGRAPSGRADFRTARSHTISDENFCGTEKILKIFGPKFDANCDKTYVRQIQLYQNWYNTVLVLYASIIGDTGASVSVLTRTIINMESCFVVRRFLVPLEMTFHRKSTSQGSLRSKQCLIPFYLRLARAARPLTAAHLRLPFAIPWPTARSQRRAFLIMADMYSACVCLR